MKRYSNKPSLGTNINWGSPLTDALIAYLPYNESIGPPSDLLTGKASVATSTPTSYSFDSHFGDGRLYGSGTYHTYADANLAVEGRPFSFVVWCKVSSVGTGTQKGIASLADVAAPTSGTPIFIVLHDKTAGKIDYYSDDAGAYTTGALTIAAEQPLCICVTWAPVVGWQYYLNGVLDGAIAGGGTLLNARATGFLYLGSGFNAQMTGQIYGAAVWSRLLRAADAMELYMNPNVMLYTAEEIADFPSIAAAGGGSSTIFRKSLSRLGTRTGSRQVHI